MGQLFPNTGLGRLYQSKSDKFILRKLYHLFCEICLINRTVKDEPSSFLKYLSKCG